MIHDRNIVCVASNWFEHPTSKHHVMRLLSERNHVLWINYHASRRPRLDARDGHAIGRRLRQAWRGPQRVTPTIDVLSPLTIPLPASRAARFTNARLIVRQIRAALRRLPDRPVQLWLFTPDAPELVDLLRPERVLYYCVDDFAAFSGFDEHLIERLERETVSKSDIVIATSKVLYRERKRDHDNTHLVPHGVDFEHFARAAAHPDHAPPDDLESIPHPVLGYMGLISDYVDLDLLAGAAGARPRWSFVLIGSARCETATLEGIANVHLLGPKAYDELPAYLRHFDVGLIPFRMNRLTRAVNPIKLREYLAAGLPVVSSPMAAVLDYQPAVQVATSLDEFIDACDRALAMTVDGRAADRQALVRIESWRSRVERISTLVTESHEPSAALPGAATACARSTSGT